ncbi:hypothetical protein HME9302_02051 [Alteripontixanthobacter maritimus]|uniref:DUF3667 domain-containing protein n=1 Tax=Alteripontixanthobacter maritimus TaxID=2161824 RepID=A0A369QB99_9SPHN|nr:DUF3667 domain-containing protein [Alteripontixanthobacter maritimus]RDC60835.1 hypothetical protein HME9302_02051 [Alteripontixanthobacter maritimus]
MSDLGEAAGAMATGGLVARAVEPAAGGTAQGADGDTVTVGHTGEAACLNCRTPLAGAHCHHCGQKAHLHRTLGAFFHDLVHGVLHFEGKLWRTLPVLAWQPGKLTRNYIDGQRARYISPIALFLFTIFITFALISLFGGVGNFDNGPDIATEPEVIETVAEIDRRVASKQETLTDPDISEGYAAELREEIATLKEERVFFAKLAGMYETGEIPQDEELVVADSTPGNIVDSINDAWKKAKENPDLLVYKLQTNSYKLSWLLIPLSLPFIWLLFPFSRKFRMYDHTVFVTYSIAFMTFLAIIMTALGATGWGPLVLLPMLYAPFHLYRQLKGTYGLSRWGATWRMLVLSVFIWIVISLFITIMTVLVVS